MKVPTYTPNVSLRPDLRQDIQQNITEDQAGAAVGRGLQGLGKGASDLATSMDAVQRIEDEASAREARNAFLIASDELKYGSAGTGVRGPATGGLGATSVVPRSTEPGYMTTSGTAALKGFDKHTKGIEALRMEHGANLSRGAAKLYQKATDGLIVDAKRAAIRHRAAALKQYVRDEAIGGAEQFKTQAVQNFADPALREKYLAAGLGEIGNLGRVEGWSGRKLKRAQEEYRSDVIRLQGLHLAQADPVAAVAYIQGRRTQMQPDTYLTTLNSIAPQLGVAVGRDAVSMAEPSDAELAATGLPKVAHPLLAIIGSADRPERPTPIVPDDMADADTDAIGAAASRETAPREAWGRTAKALDLPASAGASTAQAAWWAASQQYRGTTGRSLEEDLAAGKLKEVRAGLGETYEGVRKLTDDEFGGAVRALSARAAPADTAAKFSPQVEGLLSSLPKHMADRMRAVAQTGLDQHRSQQVARAKAHRLSVVDDFKLRIATGDEALSAQEILDNPTLDNGDRATLISSFNAKRGDELKARQAVTAFQAGRLQADAYAPEDRKTIDAAFKLVASTIDPEQIKPAAREFVRQTGIVPLPIFNAMRGALSAGNAKAVQEVAEMATSIREVDPGALERRDGGKELADAAISYRHYTSNLGLTPEAAAARLIGLRDPDVKREREALLKSETGKKFLKKQATEANVRDIFDPGLIGFDPKLGAKPRATAAAVAEYREILSEALFDANGDADLAKTTAAERFKRRYRQSDYALEGFSGVVRLPPEVTYRPDVNGSHGYVGQQARDALSKVGVAASKVYLQADEVTERDVSTGRPARYQLFYVDPATGALERFPQRWFATAPTDAEVAAAKRLESERRRDARREAIETIGDLPISTP